MRFDGKYHQEYPQKIIKKLSVAIFGVISSTVQKYDGGLWWSWTEVGEVNYVVSYHFSATKTETSQINFQSVIKQLLLN